MTHLLLVRHAQTAWNADGRFMGQADIELDEKGLRQADAVGRRLALERPEAIYTSDLKRAAQTAESIRRSIAESCAPAPPPPLIAEPALREIDFGGWQGLNYEQITANYPDALNAWQADLLNYAPPDGESAAQMFERFFAAYTRIVENHPGASVILVAHGGPLQALLSHLLGLSVDRFWQLQMSNAGISEVTLYPAGAVLNRFNDAGHLEGVH
ncbi:MAG: histidine phosphatase family protein [Anaerolineales bacterium]|nr:histidine phosphatase family protein [Anaerolineales bacterium]